MSERDVRNNMSVLEAAALRAMDKKGSPSEVEALEPVVIAAFAVLTQLLVDVGRVADALEELCRQSK